MSLPPKTGKLKISARSLGTASGRQPGTATRLTTAMTRISSGKKLVNPGTARPGSKVGAPGSVALNAQLTVVDRPTTQQGLVGMKTGVRGPQRQVQDKTYYLGLIRGRIGELNSEIFKLKQEIKNANEENSSFLSYEKRAETLAAEIKELQGELGDYNTLVDKLTVDEDIRDVECDYNDLRAQNEKEIQKIEKLFELKKEKEDLIHQLEQELEQEKQVADSLVNNMEPDMKSQYYEMKDLNEHLLKQLEKGQQDLDVLNSKIETLEEELMISPVKQEAVKLYKHLHELEVKRNSLLEETKSHETPDEERNKLLKTVKENNLEIASFERQVNEMQEKISQMQDEISQLDMDIQENQGEKNQKFRELKKKEESMDDFLHKFEENKNLEQEAISQLEATIVTYLENMSQNMGHFSHLPNSEELVNMKEDLAFKEGELKKSELTAVKLAADNDKLTGDLQKVEHLEKKITTEMKMLKEKIENMENELIMYRDIGSLKEKAEKRKKKLAEDRVILQNRRDNIKLVVEQLSLRYENLKQQLNENETYKQLGNLERKWQQQEQNNFTLKEFISAKEMDCDYHAISRKVQDIMSDYNKELQYQLGSK